LKEIIFSDPDDPDGIDDDDDDGLDDDGKLIMMELLVQQENDRLAREIFRMKSYVHQQETIILKAEALKEIELEAKEKEIEHDEEEKKKKSITSI